MYISDCKVWYNTVWQASSNLLAHVRVFRIKVNQRPRVWDFCCQKSKNQHSLKKANDPQVLHKRKQYAKQNCVNESKSGHDPINKVIRMKRRQIVIFGKATEDKNCCKYKMSKSIVLHFEHTETNCATRVYKIRVANFWESTTSKSRKDKRSSYAEKISWNCKHTLRNDKKSNPDFKPVQLERITKETIEAIEFVKFESTNIKWQPKRYDDRAYENVKTSKKG